MSWNIKTPGDYINGPLTVAGSATITGAATVGTTLGVTGDLTVATDAFKVISATKDVCIGTVTPTFNNKLTVVGGAGGDAFITSGNGTRTGYIGTDGTTVIMGGYSNHTLRIQVNDLPQMQIAPLGIFDWYDGAASPGTRMTLNSTGLGIGVTPGSAIGNLQVGGSTNANLYTQQGTDTIRIGVRASGRTGIILDSSNATYTNRAWYLDNAGSSGSLTIGRQGLDVITFDNVGNVGIGITPAPWATIKALQVGAGASLFGYTETEATLSGNTYYNAGLKYVGNGQASQYQQQIGEHRWFSAANNTAGAGAVIAFGNAKMTLDASGNLLVGKTVSSFSTVGVEASQAGFLSLTNSASTNAATNLSVYSTGAAAFRFYVGLAGTVFATNTTISAISDARLKENVQDLDVGLGAILALKPRKFDWKEGKGKNIKGDRGFIAQEFETVFPNLVDEWKDEAPEGEAPYKSVRQDLIPVLVKAIQELTARVQTLEAR